FPPAPGLFSTTMVQPVCCDILSASMRVRVSVPPPGGKGEIKVMDPSFREEAEAAPLTTSAPAMSRDLIERLNIMSLQFGLIRMRCWDWQRLPGSRTARQGCPRQSARQPRGND